MNYNFPPKPNHTNEIQNLLEVFPSMIEGHSAAYFSTPITSGRHFLNWCRRYEPSIDLSQPEYREEYHREVIEANRADALSVVRNLRNGFDQMLIDPTAMNDLPEWTQDDYRYFWGEVIERFVNKVYFMDGWQYSNGCSYEFWVAQRTRVKTCDEKQQIITVHEGKEMIAEAITEMKKYQLPTIFLDKVLDELSKLSENKLEQHAYSKHG